MGDVPKPSGASGLGMSVVGSSQQYLVGRIKWFYQNSHPPGDCQGMRGQDASQDEPF